MRIVSGQLTGGRRLCFGRDAISKPGSNKLLPLAKQLT
jgi:hypothetical protein